MKKLILASLALLFVLSGCGQSPEQMKKEIDKCESLGFGYWNRGVFGDEIECSVSSVFASSPEEKCSDTCRDLFSGLDNAWGDEADSDQVSKSILQCYNDCLERK